MQNRGLVKFFAILFALVSIYQLSFTFIAASVESKAKEFAKGNPEKEVRYLDSIGKDPIFLGFTYNDAKEEKINKGLDLEGGINVTLQISVKDILKGLANNSLDPAFNKALDEATKTQQGNESYIDAFFRSFKNNSGGTKLGSPEIFANRNLDPDVTVGMSDNDVEKVIRRKVDESVDSAFEVLRKRIDKFGVTQPNIQKLGTTGRILVELPGAKDVDRIKKLLSGTAQLEFWETYKIEEISSFVMGAEQLLQKTEIVKSEAPAAAADNDSLTALLTDTKDSTATADVKSPFLGKMVAQGGGPIIGIFAAKDTAAINGYLKRADVRALLQGDQRFAKFLWSMPKEIVDEKTKKETVTFELYAIKGNKKSLAPLSGKVITDASASFDQLGKPSVTMQMNSTGAKEWENLTDRAYKQKSSIAIVLDDVVYSAPGVSSGPITGGRSEISGDFDVAETNDLANVLRAGKLPAAADIVQSEVVGPSLGQEAIEDGTNSALIGLLLVSLWMIIYYGRAGWFSNIALAVNLLFMFGILASIGAVLTLPGIAGIVLTMGTAVDANIIIYERAKEELRAGMSLPDAVRHSFGWKGAMRSIVDANVTHILTGIVLLVFGTGPIQGFATTLLIGIVTSLFTSIFITRMLLDWSVAKNHKLTFVTNISKNWFTNFNFDFLGAKKWSYAISSIIVVVSVASLFINGLNPGADFVGGRTFQVRFDKEVSPEVVKEELSTVFGDAVEAKVFGSSNQLKVTTKYKVAEHGTSIDEEVNRKMFEGLQKHYGADMTYEKFVNSYEGKQLGIMQASKVGPTVAEDIKTNSYWAVLGAMAIVFLYLTISFRKWQYSLGAVAAVAHDVIFVLGVYSLCYKFAPFSMEIDQHFIAAILTVIGYSMNDTVIVFDRVREYLGGKTKGSFNDIVNQSVNTTMSRTVNTSLTLIMVLLIMFIFGGESIRGFIFAMLIGMIVGTYSSMFIATPILCDSIPDSEHKRIEALHNAESVNA